MSIRLKTMIVLGVAFLLLTLSLLIGTKTVIYEGFMDLENRSAYLEVRRLERQIHRVVHSMEVVARDWAPWDDTFGFLGGESPRYVEANLNAETFENLGVDTMLFFDSKWCLFYEKTYDFLSGEEISLQEGAVEKIRTSFMRSSGIGNGAAGILLTEAGVFALAMEPILPSDFSGLPRGALIVGRRFSAKEMARISETLEIPLTFGTVGDPDLSEEFRKAAEDIDWNAAFPVLLERRSDDAIFAFLGVSDMNGVPALIVRAELRPGVALFGTAVVRRFLLFAVLVTFLSLFGMVLFLEKNVLARIIRLITEVESIGKGNDLSRRVSLSEEESDEVHMLSVRINEMLESFEILLENLPDLLVVTDVSGRVISANTKARERLGFVWRTEGDDAKECSAEPPASSGECDVVEEGSDRFPHVWEGMREVTLRARDGALFPAEIHTRRVVMGGRDLFLSVIRDLSEKKNLEDRLSFLAFYDALTGLPNRVLFLDRLSQTLLRSRNETAFFSVLVLDVDRFRAINETLGHAMGDRFLVEMGVRFRSFLRREDTLARLGGNEFGVLLERRDSAEESLRVAETLLRGVTLPLVLKGQTLFPSVSIGMVLAMKEYSTSERVLQDAELALFQAKRMGMGQLAIFDKQKYESALAALRVENDLRLALAREEFFLQYQPIFSLADGRIMGLEALVRWQHPEWGLVPPSAFITAAEDAGLIVPLGEWVLRGSCRMLRTWYDRVPGSDVLVVHVNISARQLLHRGFLENMEAILEETNIFPQNLCLEITESMVLLDVERSVGVLRRLADMGMSIAVDDFGTGYSSLKYLHLLPLHCIKIDRTFVEGLDKGSPESGIVHTVLALAKSLGLDVVAEGIETARQKEILQALGCPKGQGYFFSKPLGAEDISRLLTKVLSSPGASPEES